MRNLLLIATCMALLAACSTGAEGPSESEIRATLERKYRTDLQEMIDWMVSMRGESGRQTALSMEGVSDPAEISIIDLKAEDVRELGNGDFSAKVVYVKRKGTLEEKKTARITLTELQGEWKVIGMEML